MLTSPSRILPVTALIAWAALTPLASAETTGPTVSYDRESALYQPGEKITFQIETAEKPATRYGRLEWKTMLNGVTPLKSGGERLKQGGVTVSLTAEQPGFVTLLAEANADARLSKPVVLKQNAVVAVAPEQLQPGAAAPEDFDVYWSAQKETLATVPIKAEMTPKPSKNEKLQLFDVQVECFGGKPVSGYYARPEGAAEKSLPAILMLHGAGVRSASSANALQWAGKNMLAFDVNAHGIANGQPKEFYQGLLKGELNRYTHQGYDSRDSYYFNGMFLRVIRAIDFLASQPEWDGRTLIAYGHSQGGAQSIVAAALDSRVTFYAAGVPALCDLSGDLAGRTPGWPRDLLPKGASQKAIVRDVVAYYDVANFATRVTAPGVVSVGYRDPVCSPSSVYAAYNGLGGEKRMIPSPMGLHSVDAETLKTMNEAIVDHLNR